MNVLDLFSGIGGFSLGLERAGFRTSAFCEIDPYCRKVLARHWPDVAIHDDIRKLDGSRYAGAVDVVCGGYPCQPFSTAGKQQGEADPRHLWPEMRRVVRECRPRWVLAENVRGHVSLGFDTVAAQMEADGFTVWPFIVPACAVGAPHRRDRLWIVAHHPGDGRGARRPGRPDSSGAWQPEQALPAGEHPGHVADAGGGRCGGAGEGQVEQPGRAETVRTGQALADAAGQRIQGVRAAGEQEPPTLAGETVFARRGAASPAEHWAIEPAVGRLADGVPSRVDRLRAGGNAVVPQIPELVGRTIFAYEQQHGLAA